MQQGRDSVDFSVIVPAYNSAATLGDCLAALQNQTISQSRYEIIVVDDGSTDNTADVAVRPGVRVLQQRNQGPAVARNYGVAHAAGAIVLFTDADCEPAPTWLAEMTRPLASSELAGSKGVYRTRQSSLTARFVQIEYEERYDFMSRLPYIDFVDTYAAAYRRHIFREQGGFDTSFPTASVEDQELSFRLAKKGFKMVFVPGAIVYHRHPATVAAYWRRKYKTAYWKALVLRLHPEKAVRDSHTPLSLKLQMGLVSAFAPAVLLGALAGFAGAAVLAMLALLGASFAPFIARALRRDAPVAAAAPALLVVRAAALALGLALGLWDAYRRPLTATPVGEARG